MNQEEIQAEIERIRQERATKGGRMSNAEKAQIEHLEAMLNIPEGEMTEETPTEAPAESTEAPQPSQGGIMARTLVDSLCVPHGASTRMVPVKGTLVEVPEDFVRAFPEKIEAA